MNKDRNFDGIAHKFAENVYGSDKGEIRQTIIWQDLQQALSLINTSSDQSTPLTVLDAGGGLGQMSQKLASLGHNIVLCDISGEMLGIAKQQVEQEGLTKQFSFIHSSIQNLNQQFSQLADIVLFHAVMEWLEDPRFVLDTVLNNVKPGGIVSVMFYNQHGLVMKNVTCGNIPHVLQGMPHKNRFKLQPKHGLWPENVYQWIEEQGFEICGRSGIRCFSDYIGNQQYMGDYSLDDIMTLEQKLCRIEPYLSLGRYIHVWAQKPPI